MIKYIKGGDIFKSGCHILVCPTNAYGVFGAGLAKQFAERYPVECAEYKKHISMLTAGSIIYKPAYNGKVIAFAATKHHWRHRSHIVDIHVIINELVNYTKTMGSSMAIPAIGCGLGKLDWEPVRRLIDSAFYDIEPSYIEVYEP